MAVAPAKQLAGWKNTPPAKGRLWEIDMPLGRLVSALAALWIGVGGASAESLRIAAQKTGTLAWELDVIAAHGLAIEAGLDLQIVEYASPEAGKLALHSGSADVILSDLMFVARERALGGSLVFAPYSSALGAVMVPEGSPIRGIADLKGRKIGVAGGPLDKSWLMLRALSRRAGFDPAKESEPAYGAPKLLEAKAEQGELAALLNYWNICADMETKGFRRAIDMADVERALGAAAPVALVGYAFDGKFADAHAPTMLKFLDVSARARKMLADDPAEWKRIAGRVGASSEAALSVYQARYAQGAARRPLAEEEADARALYGVIAAEGGAALVGPATTLDPAAYWRPPGEATR